MRLQKWLAERGFASRREAEKWIELGRLAINGKKAQLGAQVLSDEDVITLDGKTLLEVRQPPKIYWLLHKPDKTLSSHKKEGGKERIYDLPKLSKVPFRLFSIGRLDYRTEGLLLLTNDGELCHRLSHPRYKVPRHYQVLVQGKLTREQLQQVRRGITLDDGPVRCEVTPGHGVNLGKSNGFWYFVTVYEGRNRLVRRLFEHLQTPVLRLIRYGFGDLRLSDTLAAGDYRQLSSTEIKALKRACELV